ncbi:unnamed protein product [Camellia sinensis]
MSFTGPSVGSGSRTFRRAFEFGRTHVVRPKGRHQTTIVWLHGLGDNGARKLLIWSQLLETLPLPNIKWICPTAPSQPVSLFGGFPSTAWFDISDLSENAQNDIEGLDASAAHVASLLSTEPTDIQKSLVLRPGKRFIFPMVPRESSGAYDVPSLQVKLAVGGFSMGAATSLYSATCFALGKYGNGDPYPINLSVAVGLSGWLPCAKDLSSKIEGDNEAARRAASSPVLLCHGRGDDVVPFRFGEKSSQVLSSSGFRDVTFNAYNGLGHYTIPEELDDICSWLTSKLVLEGHS